MIQQLNWLKRKYFTILKPRMRKQNNEIKTIQQSEYKSLSASKTKSVANGTQ